jgi:hypothetical protein
MVTVTGTSYIAAPAALTSAAFTNGQFTFALSGSPGASYVVQTSTNLAGADWTPIFTNVSPFVFTDANPATPQMFYRAKVQP